MKKVNKIITTETYNHNTLCMRSIYALSRDPLKALELMNNNIITQWSSQGGCP